MATFGVSPHRAITKRINAKTVIQVEPAAMSPGAVGCKYVHLVSSVPCLVRADEKAAAADAKVSIDVGEEGVQYVPADVPVVILGARQVLTVRALERDGVFCAAPMATM